MQLNRTGNEDKILYENPERFYLGNNDKFQSGFQNGFRVHWRKTDEIRFILPVLLSSPDHVLDEGKIFKQGTRTHAGKVEFNGKNYFLKRYNCRGTWYQIRHFFKRSRALKTWVVSCFFWERGVPVPEPLVSLEKRRWGVLDNCYLLMRFSERTQTLRSLWPDLCFESKRKILFKVSEIFGHMYYSRCYHGDLKWDNILVRLQFDFVDVEIVDLDGSQILKIRDLKKSEKDVIRFIRDLEKYEDSYELKKYFLENWKNCLTSTQ